MYLAVKIPNHFIISQLLKWSLIFEWHLIISEFSHSYLIGFSIKTCVTDTFYNLSLIKKDCKTEILPLAYLAAVAVGFELIPSESKTKFPNTFPSIYLSLPKSLTSRFPTQRLSVSRLIFSSNSSMMRKEPCKLILEIWMENDLETEELHSLVGGVPGVS